MYLVSRRPAGLVLLAALALPLSGAALAQEATSKPSIVVQAPGAPGPEIKGTIIARSEGKMKVAAENGSSTILLINDSTQVKGGSSGMFGGKKKKVGVDALLNGLPVVVKTVQSEEGLVASVVSFKSGDYKTAMMIHNGTDQRFGENEGAISRNAAMTEALRGRMGDIDKYDIKSVTNVYFAVGKWDLSPDAKSALCDAATAAEGIDHSLLLVVGYTDSTGNEDANQILSEKRAGKVINHLQQVCRWKPYRVLTPTGMAAADPLASNDTPEGRAQNRRVSINVLVSKAMEGM